MNKVSIALLGAAALTLGACGGSEEANTAGNTVEDYNVAADDLGATDNLALPTDLNAADTGNLTVDTNTTGADTNTAAGGETNAATTNGL